MSTFFKFFVDKVNRIRSNIAVALQSTVRSAFTDGPYLGPALSSFQPVTTEEVHRLLSAMPSKSSPLDVLPCSLLKACTDTFAPVIAKLANLSMQTGNFPSRYKQAQVLPLLKKAGLDRSSPKNYRPISNLSTVSKILERLVLTRLHPHLLESTNFSKYQSATGRNTRRKQRCWRSSMEYTLRPMPSRSLSSSVSICRPLSTQLIMRSCSSVSSLSLA